VAVTFRQWLDAFDSSTAEVGCSVSVGSPSPDSLLTATIASAADTADKAVEEITAVGKLPAGSEGQVEFRVLAPTYAPTASHVILHIENAAGGAILELYLDSSQTLFAFSLTNLLHLGGVNSSTGQVLADATEYLIKVAWKKNGSIQVWVNDKSVLFVSLSAATGDAVPAKINVGVDHYDGADTNGMTFIYRMIQVSDNIADLLPHIFEPSVSQGGQYAMYPGQPGVPTGYDGSVIQPPDISVGGNPVLIDVLIAGLGAVAAALTVQRSLATSPAGVSAVTDALQVIRNMAVHPSGAGTVTPDLKTPQQRLATVIAGTSTITASLRDSRTISTVIAGTSTVVANLTLAGQKLLATAVAGTSTVTAALRDSRRIVTTVVGASTITANIRETKAIRVIVSGSSTVVANLLGAVAGTGTALKRRRRKLKEGGGVDTIDKKRRW
jgi:hypothetical protein